MHLQPTTKHAWPLTGIACKHSLHASAAEPGAVRRPDQLDSGTPLGAMKVNGWEALVPLFCRSVKRVRLQASSAGVLCCIAQCSRASCGRRFSKLKSALSR